MVNLTVDDSSDDVASGVTVADVPQNVIEVSMVSIHFINYVVKFENYKCNIFCSWKTTICLYRLTIVVDHVPAVPLMTTRQTIVAHLNSGENHNLF